MSLHERDSRAAPPGEHPNVRPRDAATLIVLRRSAKGHQVLMGRRSSGHAFMPGMVVFPGGSVDRCDYRAPALDEFDPAVAARLASGPGAASRARALGLAAIRETFEETGILIGARADGQRSRNASWAAFLACGVVPRLSPLRIVARAITPPRQVRRFDARFFAVFDTEIATSRPAPDREMEDPVWLSFAETRDHKLPRITRIVLDDLQCRLEKDPALGPDGPAPFYFFRRGERRRETI